MVLFYNKKSILIIWCLLASIASIGQVKDKLDTATIEFPQSALNAVPGSPDDINLPDLLPASPEAMAFVKQGVGNVNLSTGAASVKIPLYDIKIKDFVFPIYLAYSTQGLKLDEASSRVGLGWILNANAVITRSVRGEPDEFSQRLPAPGDLTVESYALDDFLQSATLPVGSGNDTQPDEFQFNVNGYSGKFILDDNMVPRVTATSNIQISVPITRTPGSTSGTIGPIILTTPDGIKYSFNVYEKTTAISMKRYSPYFNTTVTAFYLNRIDLPTGEFINFQYNSISTTVETGKSQQLIVNLSPGSSNGGCSGTTCNPGTTTFNTSTDKISYSSYYLSGITTSTGVTVNLSYQARPDLSQDNRLTTLEVMGLKKYSFEYYDLPGQSTKTTGRFFLTKVKDAVITGATGDAGLDYGLTYNSMTSTPLPLMGGQDVLGFYNGNANTNLVPSSLNSQGQFDISFRNPQHDKTMYGTLASVSYPTGGKEEYFYEPNTIAERTLRNTKTSVEVSGPGSQVYSSAMIYCPVNQTISIQTYATDGNLGDGYTAPAGQVTVIMRLYDGITQVTSRSSLGYTVDINSFNLLADHTYRLEVQVKYATENGTASFILENSPIPIYDTLNIQKPGLRVARIKYTDPINSNNYSKYYTYAALGKLNQSSGGVLLPAFGSIKLDRTYCGALNQYFATCPKNVYASSSTGSVYEMSGSGSVNYYTNVIESNSPNFIYGGTEHIFFTNDYGQNAEKLIGNDLYMPGGQYPTLSGMENKTRVFNSDLTVLSEEENVYETIIDLSTATNSYYYRKQFESHMGWPSWLEAYDVYKMTYKNYWIRLKDKISKSYVSGNQMTSTTSYKYGPATNIQPDSVITQDSKGLTLLTTYKYPTSTYSGEPDGFVGPTGYSTLVARNIITPIVQKIDFRNGVLTKKIRTYYSDWFGNGTITTPSKIQVKSSASDVLDDEIVFTKYDTRGNPLEVRKFGDIQNTYTWDKEKSLVLSKTMGEGATYDKIAYTGFEVTGDYGNWTYYSGSLNTTASYTGSNSFTGTLTKTLTGSGVYRVSLWTNNSTTVNAATGTLIKTVRGWKLYRWTLTNPTTITVSGTNFDELRLLPSSAQMVSLTHKPFIGISAKLDENESAGYFDYDYRNRLSVVKDENWSILKKNEYAYAGVVTPLASFGNDEVSGIFYKSGCAVGSTPSAVKYVIPAGTYISATSQSAANQLAANALSAGGPGYANSNGSCVPDTGCPNCSGADRKCINNVCELGGFKYTSSTYQQVSIAGTMQWRYVVTVKYCFSDGTTSTYSWQEAKTTSPTLNVCLLP